LLFILFDVCFQTLIHDYTTVSWLVQETDTLTRLRLVRILYYVIQMVLTLWTNEDSCLFAGPFCCTCCSWIWQR